MTNLIDMQNIPRLADDEKATVGIPSVREWRRGEHHYISAWDGAEWHDYGVGKDGNLGEPYDDFNDRISAPLVEE